MVKIILMNHTAEAFTDSGSQVYKHVRCMYTCSVSVKYMVNSVLTQWISAVRNEIKRNEKHSIQNQTKIKN